MPYNKSPLAFADIREAFDRALAAPRGIRIPCATRGAAIKLRARFNYYRKLDRAGNKTTYEPNHPMYGNSVYDPFTLRVEGTSLYIEPLSPDDLHIEEIGATPSD